MARARSYRDMIRGDEHLVLQRGEPGADRVTMVHLHRVDIFRDLLGSPSEEGQLDLAIDGIAGEASGIVIILRDAIASDLSDSDPERRSAADRRQEPICRCGANPGR